MARTKKAEIVEQEALPGTVEVKTDFPPEQNLVAVPFSGDFIDGPVTNAPKDVGAPTMALLVNPLAQIDFDARLAQIIDAGKLDLLERFVALAEHVEAIRAKAAFNRAFTNFQSECPQLAQPVKNQTATVKSVRTGAVYHYDYAPIEEIVLKVQPILNQHGLTHRWDMRYTDKHVEANCIITHLDGHTECSGWITAAIEPVGDSGMRRAEAAAETHAQRRAFIAVTGIKPKDKNEKETPQQKYGDPEQREQKRAEQNPPLAADKMRGVLRKLTEVLGATDGTFEAWIELPDSGGTIAKVRGTDRKLFVNLQAMHQMLIEVTVQAAKPYNIILAAEGVVE